MKSKTFKEWSDTGQFVPIEELTNDELKRTDILSDTFETLLYEGNYIIQVSHKGLFSYNKEFMSISLIAVEKFIWQHYAQHL